MTEFHNLIIAACVIILGLIAAPDIAAWINGQAPITFGSR